MLTKQECCTLNAIRHNCYGYGVSPTDASFGVIRGCPRGGVGFLWKKHLDKHISIIDCEFDWICGIKISIGVNRDYYILNVYLPYDVVKWTDDNEMRLNCDKCKEIIVDFSRNQGQSSDAQDIFINEKTLGKVYHIKMLGVTVSNDLTWNIHVDNIVSKAGKRLYMLYQLKRGGISQRT